MLAARSLPRDAHALAALASASASAFLSRKLEVGEKLIGEEQVHLWPFHSLVFAALSFLPHGLNDAHFKE